MDMDLAHREALPLVLVRGFGGLDVADEKRLTYQGFNDGTVYHQKRGENYIYEGLVLRLLKSRWKFVDATNVVGFYANEVGEAPPIPDELADWPPELFRGHKVVVDPAMALHLQSSVDDVHRTVWVFRYYDLGDRSFAPYGQALKRLITVIRAIARKKDADPPKVNIIAHSMGGLIVREAIQGAYPSRKAAEDDINKVVTLGTPHRGISFQIFKHWLPVGAKEELERFNQDRQADPNDPGSAVNFSKRFDPGRVLTVVGTNYRSYEVRGSSLLNRLASVEGEYGTTYNRSDGLVKIHNAQLDGAPRTFVHKCHGGHDSLVTSREAFEIATRFFFGDVKVRLRLLEGEVKRGKDFFGKSEFFFGVSIKPRGVDFELFHQSAEAENCYGPFHQVDLGDPTPAFGWAGPDRLIWEGWVDSTEMRELEEGTKEMVLRVDVYVGERDVFGFGFSDNVVFRKQYYVRAVMAAGEDLELFCHTSESFMELAGGSDDVARDAEGSRMAEGEDGTWSFQVKGTGFVGRLGIEIEPV